MPATERINMAKVYINEKNKKGHINPELYGNFSEHLGRCIYEGLYVGEDSEIPNTKGIRTGCRNRTCRGINMAVQVFYMVTFINMCGPEMGIL